MLTLLATGGTIACTPGKNGLEPTLGAADLLRMLGPAAPESARARDVFTLDSSNVQPEEWRALARAAHEALTAGLTPDVVLTEAEGALDALGELTGRTAREDMVTRIFERFCVGK